MNIVVQLCELQIILANLIWIYFSDLFDISNQYSLYVNGDMLDFSKFGQIETALASSFKIQYPGMVIAIILWVSVFSTGVL